MEHRKVFTNELLHARRIELPTFLWELENDHGPFTPIKIYNGSVFSVLRILRAVHVHLDSWWHFAFAEEWQSKSETTVGVLSESQFLALSREALIVLDDEIIAPLEKCLTAGPNVDVTHVVDEVKQKVPVVISLLHSVVFGSGTL